MTARPASCPSMLVPALAFIPFVHMGLGDVRYFVRKHHYYLLVHRVVNAMGK